MDSENQGENSSSSAKFKRRKPFVSATQKAMDLIAMHDHSVLELRRKLKQKGYEPEEIEKAMAYVEQSGWIRPPEQLSESFSKQLGKKNKSQREINMKLAQKGLPKVKIDSDVELEKATRWVENRIDIPENLNFETKRELKAKIARRLQSRGFSSDIIGKVLDEKFRN